MMTYKKILVSLMVLITSACGDNRLLIKIKGSDTEVNLVSSLAEKFHPGHPQYSIAVSGGGSGLGIAALLNGQADIANSSRPLTPAERRLFKAKHMRLIAIVFAEDATAFIVNRQQPIDTITVSDLCTLLNTPFCKLETTNRQQFACHHLRPAKQLRHPHFYKKQTRH